MRCSMRDGLLVLEADAADSSYMETVPVESGALAPEVFMSIPPGNLLDTLKQVDTDKVLVIVQSPILPVTLHACYEEDDPEGREYTNLIMCYNTLEAQLWRSTQEAARIERLQERVATEEQGEEEDL